MYSSDPTLGRWTQQDPLGGSLFDPSTGNRYTYTSDDPTNLTDRTGAIDRNYCLAILGIATVTAIATAGLAIGALLPFTEPIALTGAALLGAQITAGASVFAFFADVGGSLAFEHFACGAP